MKMGIGNMTLFLLMSFVISFTFAYMPYTGNYYKNRPNFRQNQNVKSDNIANERRGFWCNYMVKRNKSCIVTKLDRVVEKYHYLCSGVYARRSYCIGYRTKFVTRYAQEYRIQPVMIKDCCPGFSGKACDKECFNCTVIEKMQKSIEKLQNDQKLLAQNQLFMQTATADVSEGDIQGPRGEIGPRGPPGPPGPVGPRGPAGAMGLNGVKGEIGSIGPKGSQGLPGSKGEAGKPGPPGLPLFQFMPTTPASRLRQQIGLNVGDVIMGAKGTKGEKGSRGVPGIKGDRGSPGFTIKGDPGLRGPNGKKGATGLPGPSGLSIKGEKGQVGNQGSKGESGEKGERGEKGVMTMINGPPGENGPRGPKGNLGSKGPKGDKGGTGEKGTRGPAGIPGLPASGLNELKNELARLQARVRDLEINRCNCPTQRGLDSPDTSLFEINKK